MNGRVGAQTLAKAWRGGSVRPHGSGVRGRSGSAGVSRSAARDGLAGAALPGRQGQLLLAYLVCHRTRACPRYELEDVLWPKDAPASSDSALSSLLSKLRRALGPDALTGRAELRLVAPRAAVGRHRGARRRRRGRRAGARRPPLGGRRRAGAGRAALGAEPFLAECDGPWVRDRRREVEGLRLRALEALGEAGLRLGGRELDAAEHAARTAIGLAPFRESAHRLLMEVHEAAGNPAEALRAFDELRQLLRDELGTAPGPAVMAVHARLLRGDGPPPRRRPSAASRPGRCPPARRGDAGATRSSAARRRSATLHEAWAAAADDRGGSCCSRARPGSASRGWRPSSRAPCTATARVVLYGRFDETGPGAYQPVLEMLRGWSGGAALTGPAQRLGPRAADLAALLPELGAPQAGAAIRVRRRRPSASGCSTRSPRCWPRSPPARRCCSCSTTCSGPTARRCSWCATSCARRSRAARCSSAPTATPRSSEGHPLPELIASLRRDGMLTEVPLEGLAPRRGRRARRGARRRGAVPGLRLRAPRRDGGQPVLRRGGRAARGGRPRPTSRTRGCRRACARSRRGGSLGCPGAPARRCRSRA